MSCKHLENGICKHKDLQFLKAFKEKMKCQTCPLFRKKPKKVKQIIVNSK